MSKHSSKLPSMGTSFSLCSITISVATLIVVMSVMNGFRIELIEQIIGNNAHISIYSKVGSKIKHYNNKIKHVKDVNHVTRAYPLIENHGMLINERLKTSSGALIKGISKKDLEIKIKSFKKMYGNIENFIDTESIIIGSDLAMKLDVYIGDKVALIGPNMNATIFGSIPRYKTYKIVGIFTIGMQQYDATIAFLPLNAAQIFYQMNDSVNVIEINTDDIEKTQDIVNKVKQMSIFNNTSVVDWQYENAGLVQAMKVEENVMFLILTLFVLVSMLTILVSLMMLINDKWKSIAVLRSMGIERFGICAIFFITGFTVSICGIAFGSILGTMFVRNIENIRIFIENTFQANLFSSAVYMLSNLPTKIRAEEIFNVISMTLVFGVIVSVIPAIKATRCNMVESLKC